eukprot:15465244-Alexandrium_andersonii.AAC.1
MGHAGRRPARGDPNWASDVGPQHQGLRTRGSKRDIVRPPRPPGWLNPARRGQACLPSSRLGLARPGPAQLGLAPPSPTLAS